MKSRSLVSVAALVAAVCLAAAPAAVAAPEGAVNINTADVEQLALLPRVGQTVAQRIVDFRQANDRFKTLEELMLVPGIGEKTFELLKPYVTLTGETTLTEKVSVKSQG